MDRRQSRSMKRSKSPGVSSKKRSRSASSVKSKSRGGPSRRSSRKSSAGKYSKLRGTEPGEDEIEMVDLNQINFGALAIKDIGKGGEMRPHEIYENTQYIPNKELRLLNIPLNSSLSFQKLLFYHSTYQIIYIFLMVMSQVHRIQTRLVFNGDHFIVSGCIALWIPIEYFRVQFGYRGNINETFPELIAFQIFTIFFTIPLAVLPLTQNPLFPHETSCCLLNVAFVFFEFVYCAILIQNFVKT